MCGSHLWEWAGGGGAIKRLARGEESRLQSHLPVESVDTGVDTGVDTV